MILAEICLRRVEVMDMGFEEMDMGFEEEKLLRRDDDDW